MGLAGSGAGSSAFSAPSTSAAGPARPRVVTTPPMMSCPPRAPVPAAWPLRSSPAQSFAPPPETAASRFASSRRQTSIEQSVCSNVPLAPPPLQRVGCCSKANWRRRRPRGGCGAGDCLRAAGWSAPIRTTRTGERAAAAPSEVLATRAALPPAPRWPPHLTALLEPPGVLLPPRRIREPALATSSLMRSRRSRARPRPRPPASALSAAPPHPVAAAGRGWWS